jgi:hypothetical protein
MVKNKIQETRPPPQKKLICPENADSGLIYMKTVAQATAVLCRMDYAGIFYTSIKGFLSFWASKMTCKTTAHSCTGCGRQTGWIMPVYSWWKMVAQVLMQPVCSRAGGSMQQANWCLPRLSLGGQAEAGGRTQTPVGRMSPWSPSSNLLGECSNWELALRR